MVPRQDLPLFKVLPWLTPHLMEQGLNVFPELQPNVTALAASIEQLEGSLFTGRVECQWYEYLLISSQVPLEKYQGNVTASKAVCCVLLYKVLDIVNWIKCADNGEIVNERGDVPSLDIPDWARLSEDWVVFMKGACSIAHEYLANRCNPSDYAVTCDAPSRNLLDICCRYSKLQTQKFVTNLHVASMHLSYLFQGRLDFPETLEQLAEEVGCDKEQMQEFVKRQGMQGLRLPLQLALAVSPCVLFLNTHLHKRSVDRLKLLKYWQEIGGIRPQRLLSIERALWEALIDIATGAHPITRLHVALASIDGHLDKVDPMEDLKFFASQQRAETGDLVAEHTVGDHAVHEDVDPSSLMSIDAVMDDPQPDSDPAPGEDSPTPVICGLVSDDCPNSGADVASTGSERNLRRSTRERPGSLSCTLSSPNPPRRMQRKRSMKLKGTGSVDNPIDLTQRIVGDNVMEVIDLTEDHDDLSRQYLLSVTTAPPKLLGKKEVPLYNGLGNIVYYRPSMHRRDNLEWFYALHEAVSAHYVGGHPLHVKDIEQSAVHVMSRQQFDSMKSTEIQAVFSHKHILVHGIRHDDLEFDEAGMRTLTDPSKTFTVQDLSLDRHDPNQRRRQATIQQMLEANESDNGKILNALDFPLVYATNPPSSVASTVTAWTLTNGRKRCTQEFPAATSNWGLAATAGAYHGLHVDTHGFGTYVHCVTGSKWWVVGRPRNPQDFNPSERLHDLLECISSEVAEDSPCVLEAVLLEPGSVLYMRPNTPHSVVTIDAAICYGGHFYATSTIRDSCYGYLNCFVASTLITNAEHASDAQLLLRRLVEFYHIRCVKHTLGGPLRSQIPHVPDVSSFGGIVDILTICNLMELSNIVHHKTYESGGLRADERMDMIHGRVRARQLVSWLVTNYDLRGGSSLWDFYWRYLAHQAKMLWRVRREVEYQSNVGTIADRVFGNITRSFAGIEEFWTAWNKIPDDGDEDIESPTKSARYSWSLAERYDVIASPGDMQVHYDLNFRRSHGYTSDDMKWAELIRGGGDAMDVDEDGVGGTQEAGLTQEEDDDDLRVDTGSRNRTKRMRT